MTLNQCNITSQHTYITRSSVEGLNYSSLSDLEYEIPRATEIDSKLVIMDTDKKFGVIK